MYKLHCDLCDRDMSKDENSTTVTWEDNQGVEFDYHGIFRKPRKLKATICDNCLELLRKKAKANEKSGTDMREKIDLIEAIEIVKRGGIEDFNK